VTATLSVVHQVGSGQLAAGAKIVTGFFALIRSFRRSHPSTQLSRAHCMRVSLEPITATFAASAGAVLAQSSCFAGAVTRRS
jgi:hypothetical protein